MSPCQICGDPMIEKQTESRYGTATLMVCSKYVVHPAAFFGISRLPVLRDWRQQNQAGAPFDGAPRR